MRTDKKPGCPITTRSGTKNVADYNEQKFQKYIYISGMIITDRIGADRGLEPFGDYLQKPFGVQLHCTTQISTIETTNVDILTHGGILDQNAPPLTMIKSARHVATSLLAMMTSSLP